MENFDGLSPDGEIVTDRLCARLTEKSNDVQMERTFPMNWIFKKFHTAILVGIFTVNLAYGWMDGTDDGQTDGLTDLQVESHLC